MDERSCSVKPHREHCQHAHRGHLLLSVAVVALLFTTPATASSEPSLLAYEQHYGGTGRRFSTGKSKANQLWLIGGNPSIEACANRCSNNNACLGFFRWILKSGIIRCVGLNDLGAKGGTLTELTCWNYAKAVLTTPTTTAALMWDSTGTAMPTTAAPTSTLTSTPPLVVVIQTTISSTTSTTTTSTVLSTVTASIPLQTFATNKITTTITSTTSSPASSFTSITTTTTTTMTSSTSTGTSSTTTLTTIASTITMTTTTTSSTSTGTSPTTTLITIASTITTTTTMTSSTSTGTSPTTTSTTIASTITTTTPKIFVLTSTLTTTATTAMMSSRSTTDYQTTSQTTTIVDASPTASTSPTAKTTSTSTPTSTPTTTPTRTRFHGAFECMKQNSNIGFLAARDTAKSVCTAHAAVLNMILSTCPMNVSGAIECADAFDVDDVLVTVVDGEQNAGACHSMANALGSALNAFRGPAAATNSIDAVVVECIGAGIYAQTDTCDSVAAILNGLAEAFVRGDLQTCGVPTPTSTSPWPTTSSSTPTQSTTKTITTTSTSRSTAAEAIATATSTATSVTGISTATSTSTVIPTVPSSLSGSVASIVTSVASTVTRRPTRRTGGTVTTVSASLETAAASVNSTPQSLTTVEGTSTVDLHDHGPGSPAPPPPPTTTAAVPSSPFIGERWPWVEFEGSDLWRTAFINGNAVVPGRGIAAGWGWWVYLLIAVSTLLVCWCWCTMFCIPWSRRWQDGKTQRVVHLDMWWEEDAGMPNPLLVDGAGQCQYQPYRY